MLEKKRLIVGKKSKNQRFLFVCPGAAKQGQIWVETVIYTLIAFTLMGLVLAFVVPKIGEIQDKGVIEQSIGVLQDIDSLIRGLGGPGNQRVLELGIQKGSITIDSIGEKIFFDLESKYQYSEPGENISVGKIDVYTETRGKLNMVTLTLNYWGEYNLTSQEDIKKLSQAPVPYTISISDLGQDSLGKPIVNIEVIG